MPTLLRRPTLCSRNTYARVCARASIRTGAHTYIRITCGRSFLRTRGGIIRSATINPNDDDDAVMTLSRTSFQATSVTLRAHLPLFSRALRSPARRLFPSSHTPTLCLYPDFNIYLYPSRSSSSGFPSPGSLSRSFLSVLTPSCPTRPHHPSVSSSKLLVLTTTVYFEVGSYPVSTTAFPARFVNNSPRPLKRATASGSFVDIQ